MPSEPQQPLLGIDAGRLRRRQPEAGGVEELCALDEAAVLGVGLPGRVRVRTVVPLVGHLGNCGELQSHWIHDGDGDGDGGGGDDDHDHDDGDG